MYEQGMPDDQVEMATKMTSKFMMPGPLAAMVILVYLFIGLIASLIVNARVAYNAFSHPFSFAGRVRRTEYVASIILLNVGNYALSTAVAPIFEVIDYVLLVLIIPLLWFAFAQGAKRCHDLGKSGFWQFVPFYFLWLLFEEGMDEENEYGKSPKSSLFSEPIETLKD
jgi:uncharacterized membrane protein YhaH (DUF805 family)